jgi:phosphatidylserine synthase
MAHVVLPTPPLRLEIANVITAFGRVLAFLSVTASLKQHKAEKVVAGRNVAKEK